MCESTKSVLHLWRRNALAPGVAVILIALLSSVSCAQSIATLLEKGIFEEETAGNLDGAIAIYSQIIEKDDAARPQVAEAYYRLGRCQIRQGNHAEGLATLEKLVSTFPEQETLVARARDCTSGVQQGLSEEDVATIVENAVEIISTCAETDPRVEEALSSLTGLDGDLVVKTLAAFFDDQHNTMRRAAVYVLWRGDFQDISGAIGGLQKLCDHEEDLTRGMAALALGQRKVSSSYPLLCKMTLEDDSGFARRCGAYALGLMGNVEARPILQKALDDSDRLVANNAEAALTMLSKIDGKATKVRERPEYKQTHHVQLNADGSGSITSDNSVKNKGKTAMRTYSFINSSADLKMLGEDGQELRMDIKKEDGYYRFTAWLDRPIPPGQERTMRSVRTSVRLATERGGVWTYTRNHTPCPATDYVETVVLPAGAELVSVEPDTAKTIDQQGRKALRFEEILDVNEAFVCRIKYRLP